MKIEWKITKKRGNIRPMLSYSFFVESFEKELALPPIRVESSIAEPCDAWEEHCYPERNERAKTPVYNGLYTLEIVSHKGHLWTQKIRLPWRENNEYPEVEESFKKLRAVFEQELANANASCAMQTSHSLQISDAATQSIAPSILAERFLTFAKGSRSL